MADQRPELLVHRPSGPTGGAQSTPSGGADHRVSFRFCDTLATCVMHDPENAVYVPGILPTVAILAAEDWGFHRCASALAGVASMSGLYALAVSGRLRVHDIWSRSGSDSATLRWRSASDARLSRSTSSDEPSGSLIIAIESAMPMAGSCQIDGTVSHLVSIHSGHVAYYISTAM